MKKLTEFVTKWFPRHNAAGEEVLDPTPLEVPLRFKRPETLEEKMRRMIAVSVSERAREEGYESFEEADDFEVEDEEDPRSVHELTMAQELFQLDASDLEMPKKGAAKPQEAPEGPEATPPKAPPAEAA